MLNMRLPGLPGSILGTISERHAAGLIAALLGLVFIAGVGFAQPELIHDAAHDMRHALTFPCH